MTFYHCQLYFFPPLSGVGKVSHFHYGTDSAKATACKTKRRLLLPLKIVVVDFYAEDYQAADSGDEVGSE